MLGEQPVVAVLDLSAPALADLGHCAPAEHAILLPLIVSTLAEDKMATARGSVTRPFAFADGWEG